MKVRKLRDIEVTEVGMGCMAFSYGYGQIPERDYAVEAIRGAYEHGCNFFDTAEVYAPPGAANGHNEMILGEATKQFRKEVVLATKLFVDAKEPQADGSVYNTIRRHVEASMKRMQTDYIDLYYLHRVNPDVPVEEIAEGMGRLIREGIIRGWGMSMVNMAILKRVQDITPVSAVQNIYSMIERDYEKFVIPYCEEQNIGFVAYSPVASGYLSGKITAETEFEKVDDVRNWVPQLKRENIIANRPVLDIVSAMAERKGATNAQISMAWMLHKYPHVVPLPGSKNKGRIIENLDSAKVKFSDEEFRELDTAISALDVHGQRRDLGWGTEFIDEAQTL